MSSTPPTTQGMSQQELEQKVAELQTSQQEMEARRQIDTILNHFAEILRYRPEDTMETWADRLVEEVVVTVGGLQGSLYLAETDTEQLHLAGTYAFNREQVEETVPFGEGLLGQAARSGQPVIFNDDEAELEVRTYSGVAEVRLRALYIHPLVFNEAVQGVLEISSQQPLTDTRHETLEALLAPIAANLMSVQNQGRMRTLFEEAQQRAEELQAQEEEMRQNVEELQATQDEMKRIQGELKAVETAIHRANALIEFDLKGNILKANENFLNAVGYELHEIVGKHHKIFVGDKVAASDEYWQMWERLARGEFFTGEFKRYRKDGTAFWLRGNYNPVLGADGKPYKILKIVQDITQQKVQEEELKQTVEEITAQEEELRQNTEELLATQDEMKRIQRELQAKETAINRANAIIEFDTRGNILYANDRFLATCGYTAEELQGQHHRIFAEPELAASEEYARFWERLAAGEFISGTFKRIKKDGSPFWLLGNYNPIFDSDGQPVKVLKIVTDITEQKQIDEKLQQTLEELTAQEEELRQNAEELEATNNELDRAQRSLRAQVNAVNHAAIVSETDLTGDITFVNQTFIELSKYTEAELLGQNHRLLKSGHQPQEIFDDLWATISSGRVWKGNIKNRAKDGSYYWVASTVTPEIGADGKPQKYIAIRFDITEQVVQRERLEATMQEMRTQEEEIRQNAEELEAMNNEMERVRRRLQAQVNAVNNAAIVSETDVQGNITFVNQTFIELSKYSEAELIGENHRLLKSGHQPQEIFDDLWATISAGRVWKGNIKNRAKDGSYYWVASTITPEIGMDGKPQKYIAIRFDITAQMEGELAPADGPAAQTGSGGGTDLATILAASPDAILTADEKGILQSANPRATHMFGVDEEQLVGRSLKAFISETRHLQFDNFLRACASVASPEELAEKTTELPMQDAGNTVFYVEMKVGRVAPNGSKRWVFILRDISHRQPAA